MNGSRVWAWFSPKSSISERLNQVDRVSRGAGIQDRKQWTNDEREWLAEEWRGDPICIRKENDSWPNSQSVGIITGGHSNLIFAVFVRDRGYKLIHREFSINPCHRILPQPPNCQRSSLCAPSMAVPRTLLVICPPREPMQGGRNTADLSSLVPPAMLENEHTGDDQNTSSFLLER